MGARSLWRSVGMYGWPEAALKHKTWELMRAISSFEGPMLYGGDLLRIGARVRLKREREVGGVRCIFLGGDGGFRIV